MPRYGKPRAIGRTACRPMTVCCEALSSCALMARTSTVARELFEQAVALDPRYAIAHAYLALALVIENGYGNAPDAIKQRALETAMTAVRLDPRESRCQIFLGQVHRFRLDYE